MSQPIEARLSYLGFQLATPDRNLRPYIQQYWAFTRQEALAQYHEEYMHPSGGFGIVFNLGDDVRLDGQVVTEPVFLDGANTRSRKMGFTGQINLMGIRFHTGGAYPFIAIPLNELRDTTTLLDAATPQPLLHLHQQLAELPDFHSRIRLLEGWLWGCLQQGKDRDDLIPYSLQWIKQRNGRIAIPEIAKTFAISQRQLERLYQRDVGMTPKHYARLLRVDAARNALKSPDDTATDIGMRLGFYDQSHFIREFSAVIGMTPARYRDYSHQLT